MAYNLNEVAMITGLTTRTLRNYLKLDLLTGEKIDGNWSFTDEELDAFMSNPVVKQAIKTKRNAVVYDFLSDPSIYIDNAYEKSENDAAGYKLVKSR